VVSEKEQGINLRFRGGPDEEVKKRKDLETRRGNAQKA